MTRSPNHNFRAFEGLCFAVASNFLSREAAMGILKVKIFDGFPYTMYFVRGKRNL